MADASNVKTLSKYILVTIGIAVTSVVGIAVLSAFKGTSTYVDNTTVDAFIAGISIVSGFIGVIMLTAIGKTVIDMVK